MSRSQLGQLNRLIVNVASTTGKLAVDLPKFTFLWTYLKTLLLQLI